MAPVILANQGKDTMTLVRMNQGDPPQKIKLGGYTLELTYLGAGRAPIAPPPPTPAGAGRGGAQAAAAPPPPAATPAPAGGRGAGRGGAQASTEALAVFIANSPNEFYMGGTNGLRVAFTPDTPGPAIAGLGEVQVGRFVDGKWTVLRHLAGDDTGQGEILSLRPNTVQRVTVYRYQ
jgi:hypothetical protein